MSNDAPRVLVVDIETSPNLAYVWGLFKQNIALSQLQQAGQVISFAAKWHGEKKIEFHSDFDFSTGALTGHAAMIERAYALVNEADLIVHWNGNSFDMPHLNREFLLAGLTPPSPYKNVDLYLTARKQFRFVSNKLDNVAQELGVGRKASHDGFGLWLRCMSGDRSAWVTMRRYNRQDVALTDELYDRLKGWVPAHPHWGLYSDNPEANVCGRCGGRLVRQGFAYTSVGKFQRFKCAGECGSWSRAKTRTAGVDARPAQ